MIRAAVMGVGYTDSLSVTPGISWKDIMYRAASSASNDCGVNPRRDVARATVFAGPCLLQPVIPAFTDRFNVNVMQVTSFSEVCICPSHSGFVIYDMRR